MFLIKVSWHNEGGVMAGPEPPDGGHHVWLGEDDHAVGEGEHVGHPAQVLLIAALGGNLVIGCNHGGITDFRFVFYCFLIYLDLNILQFAIQIIMQLSHYVVTF